MGDPPPRFGAHLHIPEIPKRLEGCCGYNTHLSLVHTSPAASQPASDSRRRRVLAACRGPAILFAIVALMFWKLVFTRQYTWLDSPEVAAQILPWFQLQASSVQHWSLTLWDPYQWCGHPLAGEGQSGTLYPLNWLLWAMPLHRTWLRHVYLNWYFVLIHAQAALCAYWLCRDQKHSRPASIAGGIAFAFGPLMGTAVWPATLNAMAWAPAALLFFLRASRNDRAAWSAAMCGAAIGAACLTGADEVPILLGLAFGALWIWRASETRSVRQVLIAAGAALGIGAMQIVPGVEYLFHAPQVAARNAGVAWQSKALFPVALVNLALPGAGEPALFIGCAVLALAGIGVWRRNGERGTWVCLVFAAAAIAIAAGPWSMFSGALYGARLIWKDPHSALCLLDLALPLPVAAGLDAIREGALPVKARQVLLRVAIACGVVLFLLSMTMGDDLDRLAPVALCGLTALAAYALLEARARGAISAKAASVIAILLTMWQFGQVAGADWKNIEFGWPWLSRLDASSDIATAMRSQPEAPRLADPGRASFDMGDWFGIYQFDGLSGGTENIVAVAGLPEARALAGVGYAISAKTTGEPAFQSRSGIRLDRAPDAFPRAWVVSRAAAANEDETQLFSRPLADFRGTAFVSGAAPQLGGCSGSGAATPGIATFASHRSNHITVRAALTCPGMVVIGQTFYPGWRARVDRKPAQLYQVDGFLDGVAAPAGEHTIELVYYPWAVWTGAAISAMTGLLLLVVYKRNFM